MALTQGQITITDLNDGINGNDAIIGVLSNEASVLPADSTGVVSSYVGAVSTMSVFKGTIDDSANWTVTVSVSTGVTGSLSGKTYTVTALASANDTGYVDFTATRSGYTSIVKRFNLSKSKQGGTGGTGPTGARGAESDEAIMMNVNPNFYNWSGTLPDNYAGLSGTAPTKVASSNGTGNSARFVVPAVTQAYFSQTISNRDYGQYFYVEASFMLESGTLDGSGVLFRVNATANIDTKISFKSLVPVVALNKWYTVSKIVKLASSTAPAGFSSFSIYPMAGWTSFEAVTAKTIQIDSVKLRPATDAEMSAYDVDANTNNAITTINGSGVNIVNGNFTLQDSVSSLKYSLLKKKNWVKDHQFELTYGIIDTSHTWDATNLHMDYINDPNSSYWVDDYFWQTVGTPKLHTPYATEANLSGSAFGNNSMLVNSTNWINQKWTGMKPSTTYTLSAHFKKHFSYTAGIPKLEVAWEVDMSPDNWMTNKVFSAVPTNYGVVRYALTFTTPSNYSDGGGANFAIRIMGSDANWVMVDGVQLVEGSVPTWYDSEDNNFGALNGNVPVEQISFRKNHYSSKGGAIQLNNGDVLGINNLFMNDSATGDGEAIQWATSSTPTGSTDATQYDSFRIYNGTGYLNSKPIFVDTKAVLWTGAVYMMDKATQTITPTKALSQCANGWCLIFSDYNAGSTPPEQNADFFYYYIPKGTTGLNYWHQVVCPGYSSATAYTLCVKQIGISDTQLWGSTTVNTVTSGANQTNDVVLRTILEY